MRILYDIAFIIFGIIYLPYLIATKRYRYGMSERIGILSGRVKSLCQENRIIWVHAVSVGEMRAASILAPFLRKTFPSHTLIFSSVTHTGNKVARTIATGDEAVFYLPFDISFITDKVARIIRPELFLCLETELWPNLISSLKRLKVEIVLINGRISNKSYFRYKKIRLVVSNILKKFSLILMQSDEDAVRVLTLGAPKEKVFVTGNLKFDLSLLDFENKRQEIRQKLNLNEQDILLIAGSTHKGEEKEIVEIFGRLKKEYGNLKLLIAPRHIERVPEIEAILTKRNFKSLKVSSLALNYKPSTIPVHQSSSMFLSSLTKSEGGNHKPVFLLDTIGELKSLYSAADIVFIGGSLVKKGGQNPIEPASLAKPVICGRWTFNFQDVVSSFIENEACIQVKDKEELYSAIKLLLDKPKERRRLGINAKDTVHKNSGSCQRTIDLILLYGNSKRHVQVAERSEA